MVYLDHPVEVVDIVEQMRRLPEQVQHNLELDEQVRAIAEELRDARERRGRKWTQIHKARCRVPGVLAGA